MPPRSPAFLLEKARSITGASAGRGHANTRTSSTLKPKCAVEYSAASGRRVLRLCGGIWVGFVRSNVPAGGRFREDICSYISGFYLLARNQLMLNSQALIRCEAQILKPRTPRASMFTCRSCVDWCLWCSLADEWGSDRFSWLMLLFHLRLSQSCCVLQRKRIETLSIKTNRRCRKMDLIGDGWRRLIWEAFDESCWQRRDVLGLFSSPAAPELAPLLSHQAALSIREIQTSSFIGLSLLARSLPNTLMFDALPAPINFDNSAPVLIYSC